MTLHRQMTEALDLLDALVDDNLSTVTKERVMIWKKVARDILRANEPATCMSNPDIVPATLTGLPPYRGG